MNSLQKLAVSVRTHKSYCILIFVPYLLLLMLFHRQLQAPEPNMERRDSEGSTLLVHGPGGLQQARSEDKLSHHMTVQRRPVADSDPRDPSLSYNLSPLDTARQQDPGQLAWAGENNRVKGIVPANFRHLQKIDQVYRQAGAGLPNISWLVAGALADPLGSNAQSGVASPIPERCHSHLPHAYWLESARFHPLLGNFLYSAYYDTRTPGTAYVRIIALLKRSDKPPLFCHFPASGRGWDSLHGVVYSRPVTDFYEMCENHAKDYGGWILSCEVPSELPAIPCHVLITLHSTYVSKATPSVPLPVFTLSAPWQEKDNFGICVPPLFGYIPSTTIIEFIEFNRLLGASHVMFYQHEVPREMSKVLQYYQNTGLISVIEWDLPVQDKAIWYHGQLLAINDCLYRGMHRFKYMGFHDIDEFVVPHKHSNWTLMLESIQHSSLNTQHADCGYSFQSAFFDPLMSITTRALYDLESDLRTKSFSKVRSKVMVNPERVFELGIHHLSKPVDNTCQAVYVDNDVAFIHHYRKCVTDFDPKMNCQVFARDESLSRYIPTLRHDVHRTLWILKEIEKQLRTQQRDYDTGRLRR